ncbi:MAG: O-methyltransferase [Halanaerobiales bacterium]
MITNQQIIDYLRAIEPEKDDDLKKIERYAYEHNIPIIKKEVQRLFRVLLSIAKPKKILEVGTAIGFSSILMSKYIQSGGEIVTIERNHYMAKEARKNINNLGLEKVIHIIENDAEKTLKEIKETFDIIFIDAAKGQYLNYLPYCVNILRKDGLLISDNVLQKGQIAKSRFGISRRQRTIHNRMRKYLWEINHNNLLETAILPIGDGITISYKVKE